MAIVQKTTNFETNADIGWSDPACSCESIDSQKSDTVNLTNGVTRALHVNAAGNIQALFEGDDTPVTLAVLAGNIYPYKIVRLYTSSTTATGIHALR